MLNKDGALSFSYHRQESGEHMKVQYLEIVSVDVVAVCEAYEKAHGVIFGSADELLGGARTCVLPDGSFIGIRGPLSETEEPVVRPYWLTDDIDKALDTVKGLGAEVAHPPLEISGKGKFAIYIHGGVQHGLWQL